MEKTEKLGRSGYPPPRECSFVTLIREINNFHFLFSGIAGINRDDQHPLVRTQAAVVRLKKASLNRSLSRNKKGRVYLVGAGPGDPDLLTIKALHKLRTADIVLHDALVSLSTLQLVPKRTRKINVGKRCGRKNISQHEINNLLIKFASSGYVVVRLKSGDPLIFGRAGEELDVLQQSGIDVEIVPGITAAVAAAASAKVSLTDRRMAEQVLMISAHRGHDKRDDYDWPGIISPRTTIVVYMPGEYGRVAERLCRSGLQNSTPCVLVSQVSNSQEQLFQTTLEGLATAPVMPAPCILIVGATAARAASQSSESAGTDYIPVDPESLPAQFPDGV